MARTDKTAEIQHYVPKVLLKNFSFPTRGKEPRVHAFDKHTARQFSPGISNVVAERRFYDLDHNGQTLSFEASLSELESQTGVVFDKLLRERRLSVLSVGERGWLAIFVAIQFLRTKNYRETLQEFQASLLEKFKAMGFEPEKADGLTPLETDSDVKFAAMSQLFSSVRPYSRYIAHKDLVIFETNPLTPFWIGDNPVVMHNDREFGPYGNIGLMVTGIQIYLPLSPEITLGFWCPTIKDELRAKLAKAKQECQTMRVHGTIGASPDIAAIDAELARVEPAIARLERLLAAIENGTPKLCDGDHVIFLNSLQARWANQFVLANHDDFRLIHQMLKDRPETRKGPRMTVS